ncbi:MAG TPA: sigma-70 family RNA polymerase sigma factor [Verrucomicrobiae bacterium]|nr:sigma-70 family RNA polymerase sigma factor [Verrucomicrobiae bacterium]
MKTTLGTESATDAQLVEWSLTGDREAFGRIVEKYQSLVCSITYGATGSLTLSEDIAQETFLTAWRQLTALHDAAKLRAWLCGIARNLTNNFLRRGQREPAQTAEALEAIAEVPATEPSPSAQAVSREEEAILWRALERIPDTYREPLILFYREQQSVERVATELELSEDAVKQRLSRGRKLLADEVTAFVEGTLQRTTPGKAFTVGVLAALPALAVPAKAAVTVGAATAGAGTAAKGTTAAKSGGLLALLGSWLTPMICIVGSLVAQWLIVRAAPTPRERRVKKFAFIALWIFALAWAWAGQLALRALAQRGEWTDRTFFGAMAGFWWFYTVVIATVMVVLFRQMLAIRRQSEKEIGTPQASGTQLTLGTRLVVVLGIYLSAFLWLIDLAWRARDLLSAGFMTAAMLVLGISHFFQVRRRTGVAAAQAAIAHVTLAWAVILVTLNCRLDVWMAARCETDLAEIHRLLPAWVIPVLTLALVIWTGLVWSVAKPKPQP